MKYLLILLLLSSCYTRKKAEQQHGKAVSSFPEIGAKFCALIYPPKVVNNSDTVRTSDTLIMAGETYFDTIYVDDIKYVTKTVNLPGKTIRETVTIRDTITVVNTADLELARIQLGNAMALATDKTVEAAGFKKSRNKWQLIAFGCFAVIGLGLFFKLRNSFAGLKTTD